MTIALLDGDIVAYRAIAAATTSIDWDDDGDVTTSVNAGAAWNNARMMITSWTSAVNGDYPILCFSPRDGSNFRKTVGDYKIGRSEKPDGYWELIDALEDDYQFRRMDNLEGDDVLGILGSTQRPTPTVVVSIDKDLKTIPCVFYDPVKKVGPVRITEREADHSWMYQTLMGDQVDGYPGCPGVGPKGAEKALTGAKNIKQMWKRVVATYAEKGFTPKDALLQARFARILRREDYNTETKEIRLWHPKTPEWVTV